MGALGLLGAADFGGFGVFVEGDGTALGGSVGTLSELAGATDAARDGTATLDVGNGDTVRADGDGAAGDTVVHAEARSMTTAVRMTGGRLFSISMFPLRTFGDWSNAAEQTGAHGASVLADP